MERWSGAEASDARQHPGLAGVSVTADGGISGVNEVWGLPSNKSPL